MRSSGVPFWGVPSNFCEFFFFDRRPPTSQKWSFGASHMYWRSSPQPQIRPPPTQFHLCGPKGHTCKVGVAGSNGLARNP
jgi:hypothetical protein